MDYDVIVVGGDQQVQQTLISMQRRERKFYSLINQHSQEIRFVGMESQERLCQFYMRWD